MIGDAGEDICQPCLRIDIVHFCRDDERVHDSGALTATVGSSKKPRLSAKSDPARGAFCSIVGETDMAIGDEEPGERCPALQHVIHCLGDIVLAREACAVLTHPGVEIGGEPAVARTGKYAGNAVLQDEQAAGLALMQSLDSVQRKVAILDERKPANKIKAQANSDNLVIDYAGVPVSTFSAAQKQELLKLIGLFVGNLDAGHAKVKMDEVAALLEETWFAWVGPVTDDAVFYYRIHSPVILIEFDHQNPVGTTSINPPGKPTRDHIHVIVRTPNGNDYGKDLLAQHLEDHPHS